jgi:hypothetical protein
MLSPDIRIYARRYRLIYEEAMEACISRRPLTLMTALAFAGVFAVQLTWVKTVHGEAPEAVKERIEFIIAGWEANDLALKSLHFEANVRFENDLWKQAKDKEGKSYGDRHASIELWQQGNLLRANVMRDRTYSMDGNSIQLYVPFGEHIIPNATGEEKERIVQQYGVPQFTTRVLTLPNEEHTYMVESKEVIIDSPGAHFLEPQCLWPRGYRVVNNMSLTEKLRRAVQRGLDVRIHDLGDGLVEITTSVTYKDKLLVDIIGKTVVHMDENKGYTVQSVRSFTGSAMDRESHYEYVQINGQWIMQKGVSIDYDNSTGAKTGSVSFEVTPDSIKVNEPIDPGTFTISSLGIAKGALVRNTLTGEQFLYEDVPLRLKIR